MPHGGELEACRSGIAWARSLLRRAVRELPEDDGRRAILTEADTALGVVSLEVFSSGKESEVRS